ncbi:MAG: hypothetical protein JWP44_2071 [Mucilaginibacter sp.]|nr:hypothetical protein [Mucilaginibacter sp.]
MPNTVSLIKANPLLPAEDYNAMRSEGINLIEQLGSDIWTNYNYSDPGITILEAVCYAITDLSYRTGFDIKDLLAPQQLTDDTWKQIFYTARQILHNSALTIDDYRKLIIDIDGVRNAWLTPGKDYEVPIWIDYNFFEERTDYDCGCTDKEEKICYGKLGVNEVPKAQATLNRAAQLTAINTSLAKAQSDLKTAQDALAEAQKNKDTDITVIDKLNAEITDLTEEISELQEQQTDAENPAYIAPEIVEIEGLYNVMVEYEEDIIDGDKREEVRQIVIERLAANRNLCEDFLSIEAVEYIDFGIAASVELEENADPDQVLAQIFFTIYMYFSPSVHFNTIQQMLDRGYEVDEIFEGPALEHGFIDDKDLEKTRLYRNLMLSEIISDITNIQGIKAITYLHLPFDGIKADTTLKNYFYEWVNSLVNERKIARIQPAMSQVIFCKEREFFSYYTGRTGDRAPDKMLKLFKNLKTIERKYKLIGVENDLPVPNGQYMDLEDYYPVTYSLPMTYGVSDRAGLPANASEARQAQALQLSGYLLFFEQILADYLVQLDHLRDLFSFDDTVNHTYFTRALTEIENLNQLLIDKGNYGSNHFDLILNDFANVLQNLTETPKLFTDRRNAFLDHMLARFGESMNDYESLMQWLDPAGTPARFIGDKINILKDNEYKFISSERGKAYNYTTLNTWDTDNVSGAERRIGRLLGFSNIKRRSLAPAYLLSEALMVQDDPTKPPVQKVTKTGVPLNVIKILDPDDNNTVIFTSVEVMEGCCTEQLMEDILEHADDPIYFKFSDELKARSRRAAGLIGKFWFELYDSTDPATAVLLGSSEPFVKKGDRDNAFKKLQQIMVHINNNEGMHLVEHILLRPKLDEVLDENNMDEPVSCLNICLDECDLNLSQDEGITDPPYRKKISRIPAQKCYDQMPWILQYLRLKHGSDLVYEESVLFQKVTPGDDNPVPLKFRKYEDLVQRINDLVEYGSERVNYIISHDQQTPAKYGYTILGHKGVVLAQSVYIFNKNTDSKIAAADPYDLDNEISSIMQYFGYELDLYCNAQPCDGNADPYSFKTTIVLPCWPKRLRNPAFRNLVETTIVAESPAHIQTRVMWIGIEEMQRFERAYSNWLTEMAQTEVPDYGIVNPLVDIINTLMPCGVCPDDCNHENAAPAKR